MSAHSPGPWRTIGHPHDRPLIESADGELVADLVDRESIAETAANAVLIAAAPDLLAALKDCLAHMSGGEKSCGHPFECVCVGKNAVAAIARASEVTP